MKIKVRVKDYDTGYIAGYQKGRRHGVEPPTPCGFCGLNMRKPHPKCEAIVAEIEAKKNLLGPVHKRKVQYESKG